ncbi:UDP-N-acetylglucosamine 1-carboxyvinyltransferase [Intrasporangium sp. DVR]|uniref:UDP-N-acetylglucosamine 1-carboxyvinyltransferase n=1 Tax=Intrasporangium sp. DVR TaxID=3127867 RepID=UPI00313A6BE1
MRERFRVVGGARLVGEVAVVGAKNSALKLMAVALLAQGRTTLTNMPAIVDVRIMAELLRRLGVVVDYDAEAGVVVMDVPASLGHRADYELVRALRASISVLGPLVARMGEADVAVPGGDAIGSRGLDLHAAGLEALGAEVHVAHGYLVATAPHGLRGAEIRLEFPSVGATENILMAAVLARGRTIIDNVAREPEIVDIAGMLVSMGARIDGAGSGRIVVEGVDALRPTEHRVLPDRIAAGTWAFAAATTRGDIEVVGGVAEHLGVPLRCLADAGCHVERTARGFRVAVPDEAARPAAFDVATLPYPGFPTDLQPFALAYNSVAEGSAMVTENLFEARFRTVQELARLGADMQVDGHHVMTHGVPLLSGAPVESSDIRSGAALVVAGLVADGYTLVSGVHHIDRGYPRFEASLRSLGADVKREPDEDWYE